MGRNPEMGDRSFLMGLQTALKSKQTSLDANTIKYNYSNYVELHFFCCWHWSTGNNSITLYTIM